jgi:RNA polymerase sigma-70 factor, ECF subfamily
MEALLQPFPAREDIASRLRSIADETHDSRLEDACRAFGECAYDQARDLVNTRLMESFKRTGSPAAFSLLYELNQQGFLYAIQNRIRAYRGLLEALDVLQEVFVNIFRYPHRFDGEKPEAFRHWTNTIIRNTILKHLRGVGRPVRFEFLGEELAERIDDHSDSPLRKSIDREDQKDLARSYVLTLALYLDAYSELSEREQRALQLVEVEGLCYREASAALQIKVENLKMVIFRARRKMYRTMRRRFSAAGVPSGTSIN